MIIGNEYYVFKKTSKIFIYFDDLSFMIYNILQKLLLKFIITAFII